MGIDVEREDLIHFPEATRAFPGRKRLSLATLHRWRLHGVRGVRLDTLLIGGLRYTSREAIGRFIAAQNADQQPAPQITAKQRQRQSESARAELERIGI